MPRRPKRIKFFGIERFAKSDKYHFDFLLGFKMDRMTGQFYPIKVRRKK